MSDETPPREPPILAEKHYAAPSVFDVANLMREARRCKEAVSAVDEGGTVVFDVALPHLRLTQAVTPADFEQATRALTARTIAAARKVLRDAQVDKDEVKGVVMVGGSTRMPVVRRAVADYIAGMTDRYAMREHLRLTGQSLFD